MKKYILFLLCTNLQASDPRGILGQSVARHQSPTEGAVDQTPRSATSGVRSVQSSAISNLTSDLNCCARFCAVTCCCICPNPYPTSFCPFAGERYNIFDRCCECSKCCTKDGCCEPSDKTLKSTSCCVPFGLIISCFKFPYIIASNCFHDCVTTNPDDNRGDCCQGDGCLKRIFCCGSSSDQE